MVYFSTETDRFTVHVLKIVKKSTIIRDFNPRLAFRLIGKIAAIFLTWVSMLLTAYTHMSITANPIKTGINQPIVQCDYCLSKHAEKIINRSSDDLLGSPQNRL